MLYIILKIILIVLMFGCCLFFGISVGKYLKDYKIFQMIFAKTMGQITEVDRIRRLQMRESFEKSKDILVQDNEKEPSFIEKLYRKISMTGVNSILPGFSELSFLILVTFIGIVIFSISTIYRNVIVGSVIALAYFVIIFYLLNVLAYRRKIKVETQLLDFVNMVATASRQYSNLIDIFGATYENFSGVFSKALEECYVEAHTLNNNEIAIKHLKDKFDSVQFSFVLDNLLLCSKETGDYFTVATDLSKTVSIYITSYEKKYAILRNAKLTLSVMAVLTIGIVYILGMFLGGVELLVGTTGGTIVVVGMVLLYLYGLNMKAE